MFSSASPEDDGRGLFVDSFLGEVVALVREWLDLLYGGQMFALARKAWRGARGPATATASQDCGGAIQTMQLPFNA